MDHSAPTVTTPHAARRLRTWQECAGAGLHTWQRCTLGQGNRCLPGPEAALLNARPGRRVTARRRASRHARTAGCLLRPCRTTVKMRRVRRPRGSCRRMTVGGCPFHTRSGRKAAACFCSTSRWWRGDEHLGLRGQRDPAADGFEERDADFGFQLGELLGDRGGGVGEDGGDGRQGAAVLEFAQQAQPVRIEHGRPAPRALANRRPERSDFSMSTGRRHSLDRS